MMICYMIENCTPDLRVDNSIATRSLCADLEHPQEPFNPERIVEFRTESNGVCACLQIKHQGRDILGCDTLREVKIVPSWNAGLIWNKSPRGRAHQHQRC